MAFESLLRPWSDERTLYRDAAFCVVNKPAGVPAGAGAATPGELACALPERLALHGLGAWVPLLPVPHRASGAVLMGARGEGDGAQAPRVAGRLPQPLAGLTCVVALDDCRLPPRGQLRTGGADPRSGLEYRVLRRQGTRALVEVRGALPPDQVAAAFARQGQPVVGDDRPEAPPATRLMLHVSSLWGGVEARAPLPVEFGSWLSGAPELGPEAFAGALAASGVPRFAVTRSADAFRLLGEEAGEIAGLTVDRYGDFAVVSISSEAGWLERERIADCLMDHGASGVYVKRRVRADLRGADASELAPPLPLRGAPAPEALRVSQGFADFWVRLGDGLATGLFLDQRANWERVFGAVRGASLLNLFCYTGPFTLAAAAGGAAATASVDLSARALGRLRDNLELNGLSGAQHRLLKDDVSTWLPRVRRGQHRFDWVVLDPPSFGTRARGVLSTERDGAALVDGALALLQPRGQLLCISHHRKMTQAGLAELVARACQARGMRARVDPLVGAWDCPTVPGVSATKSVLARCQ